MKVFDQESNKQGWQPSRAELSRWLRKQVICTFSTLDESGAPEAATVAFSETNRGDFIIGTSESSHKAHNINHDPRVAMVVTDSNDRYTAQIKGVAHTLGETAFAALADDHYTQRPESLPFKDEPGQVHLLVEPSSIRFSDCSVNPWLVTEFTDDEARSLR